MKKETLRRLLIVLFLGVFLVGLNAETSATKCYNEVEDYIWYSGGKTWYKIVGVEKKGIPLIVIHGGPGATHFYLESLEALGNQRPVIFYDQQGCGYSDPLQESASWTIEFFLGELDQLIQQLGLKRYHILGQSWGGVLATEYALTEPAGLVGLVLASPCINMPLWIADARVLITTLPQDMQEAIYWSEANGIYDTPEYEAATMEYYQRYLCRLDPWPEPLLKAIEYLDPNIYHYMWGPAEFTVIGTLKDYDISPELYRIKVPTLFTCGEYDECTPETTKYLQSLVPNSTMKVFKDSAHECHLEKPREYNRTVNRFLRKAERKIWKWWWKN